MEDKDSKNSKQLILDAAMDAFAAKGFDGRERIFPQKG